MKKKFEIIRVSGVATGVGFKERLKDGSGFYSEDICSTLYDTGNDKKDAADSEKWATEICNALNQSLKEQSPIEDGQEELWMEVLQIASLSEFLMEKYKDVFAKLQSQFTISKKPL